MLPRQGANRRPQHPEATPAGNPTVGLGSGKRHSTHGGSSDGSGLSNDQPLGPIKIAWAEDRGDAFDNIVPSSDAAGGGAARAARSRHHSTACREARPRLLNRFLSYTRLRRRRGRRVDVFDDDDSDEEERFQNVFEDARYRDDHYVPADDWLFETPNLSSRTEAFQRRTAWAAQ